jgi:hypothetical protein
LSWSYAAPDPKNPDTWPERSRQFEKIVKLIGEAAKDLELTETKGRCARFCKIISASTNELLPGTGIFKKLTTPEILLELEGIAETLEGELDGKKFVYIPLSKLKFCDQPALFGERVSKCFPSAKGEIMAAGNCLSVDLNTAAVFHLMRAAEFGMRALAIHLKVKLTQKGKPKPIEHGGWDEIINHIENRIEERREKYDKGVKKNRKEFEFLKFCRIMADELYKFKEYDRNNTMHSIRSYNESEAKGVFDRVQDFMKKLSTEVSEK